MQMRAGGVSAVAEQRENISTMNVRPSPHLNASFFKVGISYEAVGRNLDNNVIPTDIIQRNWRQDLRNIVRKFIHYLGDLSICHGEDQFSPAPPVLILCTAVVTRVAVRADFDPINGKTFRRIDVSIDGENAATVIGIVHRSVAGDPNASAKGRAQYGHRFMAYGYWKILQRGLA